MAGAFRAIRPALAAAGSFAALAGAVQLAGHWHRLPVSIPEPSAVIASLVRGWPDITYHAEATVLASFLGLAAATLLCLAASALLSGRRSAPAMMLTAGLVIDSTPLIVVAPILGIWFGFGFGAHIALSVMASLYPLLVGLLRGLEEVDPQARELFDIIGAGRLQRWWKLELPSARPFLFTALKAAAPLALLGALVGEWVGAERGLGVMMVYALFGYDVALAWALVIVVCAVALLYHGVLSLLDRATARLHGEPAA